MNSGNAGRRLALGLALAAGALGATASAALAAPATTVDPATRIDRSGATVTVRGTDFTPANGVTPMPGIYVAQTAIVGGDIVAGPSKWIRMGGPTPDTQLLPDGSFETTLRVERTFGTADCDVVTCSISTWTAHSNPTAGALFSSTPISFAPAPKVTVSPTSGLPRDADTTLTVEGANFDPAQNAGNGFYVVYGPKIAEYWTQSAFAFGDFKRVHPTRPVTPATVRLEADGTFRTTLVAKPTYTNSRTGETYDCRYDECGVLTFASEGSTYRGYDTATVVSFAPLPFSIAVSPTTNLNRDAASTVTVRGAEFVGGTYVAQTAVVDGRVLTAPREGSRWIRKGATDPADLLGPGATFTTTLSVTPTFTAGTTTVDCRVTQCAISTWKPRTNPAPGTLYTTTPITFAAARPPVEPPRPPVRRDPPPVVRAPVIKAFKKAQTVGSKGVAKVAVVTCGTADCKLSAPKSVTLKIGKKRYRATVLAPKSVKPGKRATVRVKLSKKAAKAIKGRSAKVKVKLTVTAAGKRTAKTVTAKIKSPKKKQTDKAAAKKRG